MLSTLILLPLIGAILIMFCGSDKRARAIALITTLVTFIYSLPLWLYFDEGNNKFQFEEQAKWFADLGIGYHLGIDGISLFMVLLTTFLMPFCILCSWE